MSSEIILWVLAASLGLTVCLLLVHIFSNAHFQSKLLKQRHHDSQSNLKTSVAVNREQLIRQEINSFFDKLQDAIESSKDGGDYAEIEVNTGKLRILQGRLKALSYRLDPFTKGYLLSCLVHTGMSNNPFILEELDLSQAQCDNEFLFGADLSRIVARGINWSGSTLSEARLESAKLSFANMEGVRLDDAKLSESYLNEAKISSAYLKGADLQGTYLIESDLRNCYLAECNLDGAIVRKADLEGANLSNSNLFAVNLSESNLKRAIFRDCSLQSATLSEAKLHSTSLANVNLQNSDFWRADLKNVIIIGTDLQGAYLNEARFRGHYRDLVTCKDSELEKIQEKKIGLFSSISDKRFGVRETSFYKCAWWQAYFDEAASKTLLPYLMEKFAPPNGLEMLESDWVEFKAFEQKLRHSKTL